MTLRTPLSIGATGARNRAVITLCALAAGLTFQFPQVKAQTPEPAAQPVQLVTEFRDAWTAELAARDRLAEAHEIARGAAGRLAGLEGFANIAQDVQRRFDEGEANQGRDRFNAECQGDRTSWSNSQAEAERTASALALQIAALVEPNNSLLNQLVQKCEESGDERLRQSATDLNRLVDELRRNRDVRQGAKANLAFENGRRETAAAATFRDRWFNIFTSLDSDEGPWARDGTERRAGPGWARRTDSEIVVPAATAATTAQQQVDDLTSKSSELSGELETALQSLETGLAAVQSRASGPFGGPDLFNVLRSTNFWPVLLLPIGLVMLGLLLYLRNPRRARESRPAAGSPAGQLATALSKLTDNQFNLLRLEFRDCWPHVPDAGPIAYRANQIVQWAASPAGPGLNKLEAALRRLFSRAL